MGGEWELERKGLKPSPSRPLRCAQGKLFTARKHKSVWRVAEARSTLGISE